MKKGRIIAAVVVVAVVAAVVAGIAFSRRAAVPTVKTAAVVSQDLSVTIIAPGSLEAGKTTSVYPPIAGTLATLKVTDGQAVKAGDALATLDDAALKAAVAQAKAQVGQADAQAKAAEAQLAAASAQRDAARALPRDTDAQAAARSAAIRAADAAAEAATAAQDAAGAAQSAAAVVRATAEANAAKGTITAPVAGTVTFPVLAITSMDGTGPRAAPGASVSPAVPLFTITDLTQVVFAAQVDEADIGGVAPGQDARVTLDSYPGTDFTGKVSQVATSSVTTKTGGVAYVVKVPLTAGDGRLRLGMSGDAALATATVPQALVVPAQAVLTDGGAKYVYTIADAPTRVVKTPVVLGAATDTLAQVTSGLAAGDRVATTGLTALTDGAAVNVST